MRFFRRLWVKIKKLVNPKPKEPTRYEYDGANYESDYEPPTRTDVPFNYFHPDAVFLNDLPILKGDYIWSPGNPKSLTVGHITAGWQKQKPVDFFTRFIRLGYFTDFIDSHGNIFQQGEGDETGPHVGKSEWKGLRNFNRYSRGVEMACGGMLKIWRNGKSKYWSKRGIPDGWVLKTSFGKVVEKDKMRYVTNSMGYVHSGWFEMLTPAQELAYAKWLIHYGKSGVKSDRMIEHADASPDRRNDIGGCLSMPHKMFIEVKVLPSL